MAKNRNSNLTNEPKCHPIKLKEYCEDKVIPLTIQSRVISGNTDTIYWGSYTHLWHCHSDFAELVIVISGSTINNFPDGQTILMQAGDLMLMTPGSMHHYTEGRQLKYFNLLFDTRLFELFPGILEKMPNFVRLNQPPEKKPTLFHLEEKPFATAASLLEDMMQEELNRSA